MINHYEKIAKSKRTTIGKDQARRDTNVAHQEIDSHVEHPVYEPKFIRGPTAYQTGNFRNIREGPETEEGSEMEQEELEGISFKESEGKTPSARMICEAESDNADLKIGEMPNHQKVILSKRKNDESANANTFKERDLHMTRAHPYFPKRYTTYAQNVEEAFCHFLEPDDSAGHFMKYLERAALQEDTADIYEVFPFLKAADDLKILNQLLDQRNKVPENGQDAERVDDEISSVRAKIYDNQIKKVQFKKRVEKLLKEVPKNTLEEKNDDFWLWTWLKKLLKALEDEIKALEENTDLDQSR